MKSFHISQTARISKAISRIEIENHRQLGSESRDLIHNFYLQVNQQPIQFTANGFYTFNFALLASVSDL